MVSQSQDEWESPRLLEKEEETLTKEDIQALLLEFSRMNKTLKRIAAAGERQVAATNGTANALVAMKVELAALKRKFSTR